MIPEDIHETWHRFIEKVNDAAVEVFGTSDSALALVIGVQFGDFKWGENGNPECLLTSNLPLCLIPDACNDMVSEAVRLHEEQHGDGMQADGSIRQRVGLDAIPEEAREEVERFMAEHGISAEEVAFVQIVDASDLADLPETTEG